jgi:hypothetical protein
MRRLEARARVCPAAFDCAAGHEPRRNTRKFLHIALGRSPLVRCRFSNEGETAERR